MDGCPVSLSLGSGSPLARGPPLGGAGLLMVYPSVFGEASLPVEAPFLQVSHPLEVANALWFLGSFARLACLGSGSWGLDFQPVRGFLLALSAVLFEFRGIHATGSLHLPLLGTNVKFQVPEKARVRSSSFL